MKTITLVLAALVFCAWGVTRVVNSVQFKQDCGGYLRRASNANTTDIAAKELRRAIAHLEREGLTNGYTSVLWRTPDEDVGYWYGNLKASLAELEAIKPESSQLERTNVLMKLRETLTDQGESGTVITSPDGISVFPNNPLFLLWGWLGAIILSGALFVAAKDDL